MDNFVLFSLDHLLLILGGFFFYLVLFFLTPFFNQRKYGKFLAFLIFVLKFCELAYRHYLGAPIHTLLPLHLCNLTLMLTILLMFIKSDFLFQLCYIWSLGAYFALITPDVIYNFPNFLTISFFLTHMYIIFAVFYNLYFFKYRPSFTGYISSFITLNIICLIVYFINEKLGTNYLYVNHIPSFKSPISYFGKWPYYIIVIEFIYLVLGYLVYYPFRIRKSKFKRY